MTMSLYAGRRGPPAPTTSVIARQGPERHRPAAAARGRIIGETVSPAQQLPFTPAVVHRLPGAAVGDAGVDWEVTYREHVSWVYAFVNRRVGNRPDAEDLTSEVFLRALPRLRLGAAPEQLRAYLAATARSLLAEHWQRHYDLELPSEIDGGGDDDEGSADDGRGVAQVHRLLEMLPEHYRRILELRFLRGYSIREAAGEMRISIGNAKVLQHRALRRAADLGEGWNP